MQYNYKFDKDKCWYKKVCRDFPTADCDGSCLRYLKFHYVVTNSLLPEKLQYPPKLVSQPCDIKSFEKLTTIKRNIKKFVDEGDNLLIYSSITGNGKTAWASKLLLSYFDEIWAYDSFTVRGLFISVAKLCIAEKEKISSNSLYVEHIKENIEKADIVIWDDIGIKSLTDYEHDYLYAYINDRVSKGKCNIFTANGNKESLEKLLGDRLYSRVWKDSVKIEIKGKDMRGE